MKTKINVKSKDKNKALKLGAKYDKENKTYYVSDKDLISKYNKYIALTVELVPSSNWRNNVRSVYKNDWDWIRRLSYKKAGYKCEICGGVGKRHPVECHEIWEYYPDKQIQKLMGLISLCPSCHKVKHTGLAMINGEDDLVISQITKVNGWTKADAEKYIDEAFQIHAVLSQLEWTLDLSYLDDVLKQKTL